MALLINSNAPPPGDWQFTIAAANKVLKSADVVSPPQPLSLDQFVRGVIRFINGNPWLLSQGYSNDFETVKTQVREHEGARMLAMGLPNLVQTETSPPKWNPPQFIRRHAEGAAGAVKRTASGVKLVVDWLGSGLRPVASELAEKRAKVCVKCPQNLKSNWLQSLDAAAAAQVKKLIEIKNDLKLSTSSDSELKTCTHCDCYLPLKVWANIDHILNNLNPVVKSRLDSKCWIFSEEKEIPPK